MDRILPISRFLKYVKAQFQPSIFVTVFLLFFRQILDRISSHNQEVNDPQPDPQTHLSLFQILPFRSSSQCYSLFE